MAKRDKSDDSQQDKSEKRESSAPARAGGGAYATPAPAKQKPNYESKAQPSVPKKTVQPKQSQPPKQASKAKPSQSSTQGKKNSTPAAPKKERDREASASENAKPKESTLKHDGPSKSSKADVKKSPDRSFAGKKDDHDKGGAAHSKDGMANRPAELKLPGKRPGLGSHQQGLAKGGKEGDRKGEDRMSLPGKRPEASGKEKGDRPERSDPDQGRKKEAGMASRENDRMETKKHVVERRPGQNTKQVRRPEMDQKNANAWWNRGNVKAGNRIQKGDVVHVTHVHNNFQRNVNWSTRRSHWGYNPWWNRPVVRPWYGSCWNGGWNNNYYRHHYYPGHRRMYPLPGYHHDDVAEAIGWGLIGWSLGALIYDTGYRYYHNPYPVRPVYVNDRYAVTYSEPMTQVAVKMAPEDDALVEQATTKSESLIGESQAAFKKGEYLVALELADKAIAQSPGDGALHEYRALVLFALGKYGEAAGVLNPVLASGPGWDWPTMIALYGTQKTYTDQLQRLEAYTEEKPDAADSHFLLGYHYMVCGHFDLATPQFEVAHKLMPSDGVSMELAELTRASLKSSDEPEDVDEAGLPPRPVPVPLETLAGAWASSRESGSTITLTFKGDGTFTWIYSNNGKTSELSGEYSMNDDGMLVLDSGESQMVANVTMPQESVMKFMLAGGPPADPGLVFNKAR